MTTYSICVVFDGRNYVIEVNIRREGDKLIVSFGSIKRATLFGDSVLNPNLN